MEKKQSQQIKPKEFDKLWGSVEQEREKHRKQLEVDRLKLIEDIKKVNKEDILPKKPKEPEKLSLWKKIQKVLMG
jgi:hypothetical protein